jgi:hypothetical protein
MMTVQVSKEDTDDGFCRSPKYAAMDEHGRLDQSMSSDAALAKLMKSK